MRLTLYGKPGCHLCDDMKAVVRRVIAQLPAQATASGITIDERDISDDRTLLERYGLEIPVLMIDGMKVAKYRISETELRRAIEGRVKF